MRLRYGESEYNNDIDRAYALKQSLKNKALDAVMVNTADQPNAYNHMWYRLNLVYMISVREFCMPQVTFKS